MVHPIIVWFRNDLRLADHPALREASTQGPVVPLYIYPEEEGDWPLGAASKVYLHESLTALKKDLPELVIRRGKALEVLLQLIEETGAQAVYWGRKYEPYSIKRDTQIKKSLKEKGLQVISYNHSLLLEPWQVLNKAGKPYTVFTHYYHAALKELEKKEPLPAPKRNYFQKPLDSLEVADLELLPKIHWDDKIRTHWKAGEKNVKDRLSAFCDRALSSYAETRDYPYLEQGVSHLSPALHFGEISPRTVWFKASQRENAEPFLRQLIWRDFAHYLLYHFPDTDQQPFKKEFAAFPWKYDEKLLCAWKKGLTGYPLVDAGMRELWETGWMHNRVRMVVASFLVKDLFLPWQAGARHFWDTLVDADLANNSFGWQWSAGCGADAAPFFRIFHPTLQSKKFDPQGEYIRKWVPELKDLADKWIHSPQEAPQSELIKAGIELGKSYPLPLVDHKEARAKAMAAYYSIRKKHE